jgi:NADH dehydrogenase [ubiquinone] 1 alpha subcomplex assembly factor 1
MKHLSALLLPSMVACMCSGFSSQPDVKVFDFREPLSVEDWVVEDDGVMGGKSRGKFTWSPEGYAVFSGRVSLENNGGFSSVQKFFEPMNVSAFQSVVIRLRGDGKDYRFIVEAEENARHYYSVEFSTNGRWQEVEIPFADLYAVRRGDRLDLPNFSGRTLAQIRFMIANGREEDFRLEIAEIYLRQGSVLERFGRTENLP